MTPTGGSNTANDNLNPFLSNSGGNKTRNLETLVSDNTGASIFSQFGQPNTNEGSIKNANLFGGNNDTGKSIFGGRIIFIDKN